ncbi:MAG: hypothetical protein MPK62_11915 [Alphaproteobacteria bacterium]|nr:hypothetical protein [Alphaproteobacteria bacterium]
MIFTFDGEADDLAFIGSATGLGFIYQAIYHLLNPRTISREIYLGQKNPKEGENFTTILYPEQDTLNIYGGIYSNENKFLNLSPNLKEFHSTQIDFGKFFDTVIELKPLQNNWQSHLHLKRLCLLLAFICLALLFLIFYFGNKSTNASVNQAKNLI